MKVDVMVLTYICIKRTRRRSIMKTSRVITLRMNPDDVMIMDKLREAFPHCKTGTQVLRYLMRTKYDELLKNGDEKLTMLIKDIVREKLGENLI